MENKIYDLLLILLPVWKALLIIVIALIVILVGNKLIRTFFNYKIQKSKDPNNIKTLWKVIDNIFRIVILFISTAIFLKEVLEIDISSILTVAGVSGIAIGFASQTIIKDFLTGIMLIMEDTINIGDKVTINGITGIIENLNLRSIGVRREDGALHVIPNNVIKDFINYNQ